MDGNTRTFTEVDHDPKTKINVPSEDGTNPTEELKKYRKLIIEKILSVYAGYCPTIFMDFTIRGEQQQSVTWDETMLRDEGTSTDRLTQLYTLASNAADYAASGIRV